MSLPKIDVPLFRLNLPSNGKEIEFRPFLVKEEKILLMALEGGRPSDMIRGVTQVVNNCLQTKIDIQEMPIFDLEYLFINLRAKSVNNIVKLTYRDTEDEKSYTFEVDLEKVEMESPKPIEEIEISDKFRMTMKYPTVALMQKHADVKTSEGIFKMIAGCLDTLIDVEANKRTAFSSYKDEEIEEFLTGLPLPVFEKIQAFVQTTPSLKHEIKYKNSLDHDRTIKLSKLADFFT